MAAWRASINTDRIELTGELRAHDARWLWTTLNALAHGPVRHLDLDLRRVSTVDARAMALLVELRANLAARGIECEVLASDNLQPLVHLFAGDRPLTIPKALVERGGALANLGAAVERGLHNAKEPLRFAGELVDGLWQVLKAPRRANWRALPGLIERAGADAIFIVLLLDFLVGFVIAFQAMPQLRSLGAGPYVADLVGIAVTRELAPLMTAIIIAGRSGAAFAAELGTMHVSDEIDALETMGISPIPYLVIPRVVTLAFVAPLLALLGDVAAVLGGLVVAVVNLELTPQAYMSELQIAVAASDIWTGLIKSVVFAIAIAIIGCQEGLAARGAAAGVGRRTTATVVVSLFSVVVIDSLMTVLFRAVGV